MCFHSFIYPPPLGWPTTSDCKADSIEPWSNETCGAEGKAYKEVAR